MKTFDLTGKNSYAIPAAMRANGPSAKQEADRYAIMNRGAQNRKRPFRWLRRFAKLLTGGFSHE